MVFYQNKPNPFWLFKYKKINLDLLVHWIIFYMEYSYLIIQGVVWPTLSTAPSLPNSITVSLTPHGCLVDNYEPFGKQISFLAWKNPWT